MKQRGAATFHNNVVIGYLYVDGEVICSNNSFNNASSVQFYTDSAGEAFNNIWRGVTVATDSQVLVHDNLLGSQAELENLTYAWTGSDDAKFQLRTDSNGLEACSEGADCGAFAGTAPYILSGIPARPRISNLGVPSVVLESDSTMTVTVSAEGRN